MKEGLGDERRAQKGDDFIDFINVKSNIDTPTNYKSFVEIGCGLTRFQSESYKLANGTQFFAFTKRDITQFKICFLTLNINLFSLHM